MTTELVSVIPTFVVTKFQTFLIVSTLHTKIQKYTRFFGGEWLMYPHAAKHTVWHRWRHRAAQVQFLIRTPSTLFPHWQKFSCNFWSFDKCEYQTKMSNIQYRVSGNLKLDFTKILVRSLTKEKPWWYSSRCKTHKKNLESGWAGGETKGWWKPWALNIYWI